MILIVYLLTQDSAAWYNNERQCGRAILEFCSESGTPRKEVFFATKLQINQGYAAAKEAIRRSLDSCGLGYIDLYMIHSPLGGPQARRDSWRAILEAKAEGIIRSVGVSNFGVRHLQEMVDSGVELPVLNQVCLIDDCYAYAAEGKLSRLICTLL